MLRCGDRLQSLQSVSALRWRTRPIAGQSSALVRCSAHDACPPAQRGDFWSAPSGIGLPSRAERTIHPLPVDCARGMVFFNSLFRALCAAACCDPIAGWRKRVQASHNLLRLGCSRSPCRAAGYAERWGKWKTANIQLIDAADDDEQAERF